MGKEPAPRLTGRVGDNLAALELVKQLHEQDRPATEQERQVLAGWRSWGAAPQVFEETSDRATRLRGLLSDAEWAAARRTTINAHYTDPAIAAAIWSVVLDLHGRPNRVLEPGCGSGVFFGTAPDGISMMVGVELDPTSAAITRALYPQPHFHVRAESFAHSRIPPDAMDVTIGNVPFAKIALHDPEHNRSRHTIHNHFILKSLALTRPGGMVAVLTSRYTLDALDPSARREMHARADLLAAVRLPSGAHRAYAGTEAVTDLVVFRVRPAGQPAPDTDWLESRVDPDLQVPVNGYWRAHPDAVLGQMRIDAHGVQGRTSLSVIDDPEQRAALPDRLRAAAVALAGAVPGSVPVPQHPATELPELTLPPEAGAAAVPDGRIVTRTDGGFAHYAGGVLEPLTVPSHCVEELRLLVRLREQVLTVLDIEARSREDTPELHAARFGLSATYGDYRRRFGPINRVRVTETSRLDKAGHPIVTRRFPAAARIFRGDPHAPTVRALEMYDEAAQTATPAAILSRRVLTPHQVRDSADTPADALAICLDTHGQVDLDRIAALLSSRDSDHARAQLGTLVFDDPVSGQLIPAPQYLSGNVRKALAAAQQAAQSDPQYAVNVDALTAVVPGDLTPEEITASLGAVWIPASDITGFLREVLDDRTVRVEHLGGAAWKVRDGQTHSPAATVTWGTSRMSAHEITERLMCQKRIVVHDTITNADGNDVAVVNPVETEAAAAKGEGLQARFREWIWSDPDRADRLARVYNDTFNAIVLRSYDAEGDRLTLPGLATDFTPHRHQRAAVARMIGEPAVGLFHAVGAGKTAEMVIGATELRRLGLVTKPAVVVPNHMLEQFTREWLQLYPAANILAAASEDLRGQARRTFIARAATGDWDAVILTQGAFASIPVSPQGQSNYLDREVQVLRDQLHRARGAEVSSVSIKQMEGAVIRLEEKVKARLDHKTDPGLTWEQLGVDYLIIDELHLYKNLTVTSNIQDVARDGSIRATDLDMKIGLLREQAGPGGHVLTGATATPIANTMAEAWVMQRYLRPDLLTDAGLTDFDSWAATFGQTVTKIEMRPAGDGFRAKDRFASFQNLPELLSMWHVPADVKTNADLGLPVPDIARDHAGRRTPEVVAIPLSETQQDFMATLADRSEKIRNRQVTPDEDNMLKVSGDGRKAGIDLRLLADAVPTDESSSLFLEPGKLDVAADRIHQIWAEHRATTYPGSKTPGSLQLVFCDLGTPNPERWNVYDALRDALAERGMDPARVRYIHEANTDTAKGRLFAQCRAGEVDVLIGSTAKMGVGTNIQKRAIALHHLDCPWRPADVEQREGRIIRQGNDNPEVQILRYVTEGSFDGYMWQGVARKAAFIDQVMHARLDVRTADDLDGEGEQFDYATVTAVASGNPLLLQRASAQADVDKLARLESAHDRAQGAARLAIRTADHTITTATDLQGRLAAAITATTPTAGDAFTARINGTDYTDRPNAATAARRILNTDAASLSATRPQLAIPGLIDLGGHTLDAALTYAASARTITVTIGLPTIPEARFAATLDALSDGYGLITRAENLLTGLHAAHARAGDRIVQAHRDRTEAEAGLGKPFPRASELHAARSRLADIEDRLTPSADRDQPAPTGALPARPHPARPGGHQHGFGPTP